MKRRLGFACWAAAFALAPASAASPLDACLSQQALPRVARVVGPQGDVGYVRVLEDRNGRPTLVAPLAGAATPLAEVFERAAAATGDDGAFEVASAPHVCAPVDLPQAAIDAETQVVVAAGLNYAAHAEEAGGGEIFVFPKPVAPTGPYARVHPPADVLLLDYEVELAFVLLDPVDPASPPPPAELLAQTAFFVSNDVSDREPIIRYKAFSGPGTGFVDGKGQGGFLPTGPWMVRGRELFAALEVCGADGLGIELAVDEGEGPKTRQSATTALMILPPRELLARIGQEIEAAGLRTPMPLRHPDGERFYPFAVGESPPVLPAGSVILTGTPEGVALAAPSPLGLVLRGLVRLRSPFTQLIEEERARVAAGVTGSYLEAGDRVHARIDGLGAQEFEIAAAGSAPPPDACATVQRRAP